MSKTGIAVLALALGAGCRRSPEPEKAVESAVSSPAPVPSASAPIAKASPPTPAVSPAPPSPCPDGMALVADKFCIDRWEAITLEPDGSVHSPYHPVKAKKVVAATRPNTVPQAYIGRDQADAACERAGKRLCTTAQWVDACMGIRKPKRQFPYGLKEAAGACNVNRRHPRFRLKGDTRTDVLALNNPELNQLTNTVAKTGSFEGCTTPEGVLDLHGNLLEWTRGDPAILMGGHYVDGKLHGPGCTYETDGHGADYHDFTTGFRCCKKPDAAALAAYLAVKRQLPPPPAPPIAPGSRDPAGMRGFTSATGRLPEPKPPPYDPPSAACPVDMVKVSGLRCSEPKQFCKEWLPRKSHGTKIACKEFAKSRCEGSRRELNFCIDRYEYTPEGYAYPLTHVSWTESQNLCRMMGKRLCLEDEWEFACEGPEALPYPYGYSRDGQKCNHDFVEEQLVSGPDQFIDRRVAKDALPECKSPFGVFNLVGNVDEWTTRSAAEKGWRSILRGGWWLIGRNRCRAATANHNEIYGGVQTGFRCCKEARNEKP